jgi:Tol biopolymer transport system component
MESLIEIYDIASGQSRTLLRIPGRVEAPNWAPLGSWAGNLLVNSEGRLFRIPLDASRLVEVETGFTRLNNDHGFSPDGKEIAFSTHHHGQGAEIWILSPEGVARKLSPQAPSWFHGWSPDGATITYVAARGSRVIDVHVIPAKGGVETKLTGGEGQCDGPDFSADGTRIYYNCDRDGHAQIWVMNRDGSDQRKLFADDHVNWFPHPSPDGRHLVYLAYPPGTQGHPADLPVALVLCDPEGGNRRRILEFTGGQGTLNVPSWAPDGSGFAYVRYIP